MSGRAPGSTSPGSNAEPDPGAGATPGDSSAWLYGADLDDLDEEADEDPDYVDEGDEDEEVLDFFDAEEGDEIDEDDIGTFKRCYLPFPWLYSSILT